MKPLRCLLVDDERLARLELSALLREAGGCTVVGEAANATEAAQLAASLNPDVLFLDIDMPLASGFELLDQLNVQPPVVFVTAYDQYAVQAFAVRAFDYLLKPVRPERLSETLNNIREQISTPAEGRLYLPHPNGGRFVSLHSVTLVRAYDHYVRIYHPEGSDLLRETFSDFIARLPPEKFFRANRSAFIRVSAIQTLAGLSRGRYLATLINKEQVTISERRGVAWRKRFG